jgi:hypothetical protein
VAIRTAKESRLISLAFKTPQFHLDEGEHFSLSRGMQPANLNTGGIVKPANQVPGGRGPAVESNEAFVSGRAAALHPSR